MRPIGRIAVTSPMGRLQNAVDATSIGGAMIFGLDTRHDHVRAAIQQEMSQRVMTDRLQGRSDPLSGA